MRRTRIATTARVAGMAVVLAAAPAHGGEATRDRQSVESRLERLLEQNERMQQEILRLSREVEALKEGAHATPAAPPAPTRAAGPAPPVAAATQAPAPREGALLSRGVGSTNLQLLDVSLDVLAAVGGSTASDEELERLQGGGHDPRQRGFTLQNVELSLLGAVDPYLNAEAHLIYFLDTGGESRFEVEEAFVQSVALPFGLDEAGLQLEAGHFFTEFGRINPQHPHAWDWQDQPFVLSRVFGEDGMRAPGLRAGWLLPLPWFSELHFGVQNAKGETMTSFLADDEVFEERAIGGRPFADRQVQSLDDLVYLARSTHGFDLSDTTSAQLGASMLAGPNATGSEGETWIYGADFVAKWRPLHAERGWPFLKLQGELLYRRYQADAFFGCFEEADGCTEVFVPGDDLEDWGGYVQALWGFRRNWAVGLRYGYGNGSGAGVAFDEDTSSVVSVARGDDPFRAERHRVSPLLAFHPTEFTRLRLQYNWDRQRFLGDDDQHSVWAGIEFLIGSHPAHAY